MDSTLEPVKVLIVDDQPPFRAAARAVVARVDGFALVGEAISGEHALELVDALHPDLVLMDINLGGIDGIEATRRIASTQPAVSVMLLSTYREEELPSDARSCGAIAYINKDELSPKRLRELWAAGSQPGWSRA